MTTDKNTVINSSEVRSGHFVDGCIASLNKTIDERDQLAVNLNQAINERDEHIHALNQTIEVLTNSRSWKITKPLRWCNRQIRRATMLFKLMPRAIARKGGVIPLTKSVISVIHQEGIVGLRSRVVNIRLMSAKPILSLDASVCSAYVARFFNRKFDYTDIILDTSRQPIVSIIIPTYGKSDYTYRCLASIAANQPAVSFEVIVIDDNSSDISLEDFNKIKGIRFVSNSQNLGFIRSCNLGAKLAIGEYLYFLNNDTIVTPDWLNELIRTFHELPGTGLVGSKLIYPDGTLQEAGGIIWQDGSAWNFGRNQDLALPVFNYAREVDYCSGASIMVPKALFEELGGFDEHYLPAYCEDADLALKIRDKGYRVIYQPLSTVVHYEGITSGTDTASGVKSYQIVNTKKLFERWKDFLKNHKPNGIDVDNEKDRTAKRRVLVLDSCTPTPDQDSGSIDTFNVMVFLREIGFQVTFIPEDNLLYVPGYTAALQRIGIEVLYHPYCSSVHQHLEQFGERYDLVLLFRTTVASRHLNNSRKFCPKAKIFFNTVDLHYIRMTREAQLFNDIKKQNDANKMKSMELANICLADVVTVISSEELKMLKLSLPDQDHIHLLPFSRTINGTDKTFKERKDIVFVGGFQHPPNTDAVKYFVNEVMPIVRELIPGVCFYVVGSKVPAEILALAREDVIISGFIEDLDPFLAKIRVSIAPLRYGAGVKGKVATAMSVGLPSVVTSLAAEGMELIDGENILIADDPEEFAQKIERLYRDEILWRKLSENGVESAKKSWGAEAIERNMGSILQSIGICGMRSKHPLRLYH